MDKSIFLQRFHTDPDQKLLFSKVLDRFFLCVSQGEDTFTPFFDPVKCDLYSKAIGPVKESVRAFGGTPECERRMLGFSTEPGGPADDAFPIDCLKVSFNKKFNKPPRHQDLLGALLGLGIDRSRIGDIRLLDSYAEVFVHKEISRYVLEQFTTAGRTPVTVKLAAPDEVSQPAAKTEKTFTAASLRLDAVVATVFHLSRGEASSLIVSEKVFVNWSIVKEQAYVLREGDMISVRGTGRFQLLSVGGKTKKDRVRFSAAVY